MIPKKLDKIIDSLATENIAKLDIRKRIESFGKIEDNKMIIFGSQGSGKTYFLKSLIENLDEEFLYFGTLKHEKVKEFESLKELSDSIVFGKRQVVIFEDFNIFAGIGNPALDRALFDLKRITGMCSKDKSKLFIFIQRHASYLSFFDGGTPCTIYLETPDEVARETYLKDRVDSSLLELVVSKTAGFTYGDLNELVHMSHIIGEKSVKGVLESLNHYQPSLLCRFDIDDTYDLKLKDLIGREEIKKKIMTLLNGFNEKITKNFNIKRSNCLLFTGKPGTGKSYMVRAISGELNCPILSINAKDIESSPFNTFYDIIQVSKIRKNLIVYIDEADKLFGKEMMQSDTTMIGEFNKLLDGIGKKPECLFILTVNESERLGYALRDRFLEIEFDLPSSKERETFFKKQIALIKQSVNIDLSPEVLAYNSKNMTFRELERLWDGIILEHLQNPELSLDELVKLKTTAKQKAVIYG